MGRGRNPTLSESELVSAIDNLTGPGDPVADTAEVHDALDKDVAQKTVSNTLRRLHEDDDSPVWGRTAGEQKGWLWYVHQD